MLIRGKGPRGRGSNRPRGPVLPVAGPFDLDQGHPRPNARSSAMFAPGGLASVVAYRGIIGDAGIVAAFDPIDDAGSRIGARFDAAVSFLDGGFGDGFGGGSGAEIVLHIGFESRLTSLEGQQVVGLVLAGRDGSAVHSAQRFSPSTTEQEREEIKLVSFDVLGNLVPGGKRFTISLVQEFNVLGLVHRKRSVL